MSTTAVPDAPATTSGTTWTSVPALVLDQARRTPDVVAVECGGAGLTYRELVDRAAAVADRLRRDGLAGGQVVAVSLPRDLDLPAVLLGVQLAGAAYLPIDPEDPRERIEYILGDAGVVAVIAGDTTGPLPPSGHRVVLDGIGATSAGGPPEPPSPDAPAYVIYTSGSTGRPKGVSVPHSAVANFMLSMRALLGLGDDVALPATTTLSFDIAALELFLPLVSGGRVVIGDRADAKDPTRLAALLEAGGLAALQATPTSWRLLLAAGWQAPRGFTALCGGERLPPDLAERLLAQGVTLWDLYGPTETTIWSSVTRYARSTPPRFHPVRATSLHVLDASLAPVAPGGEGELYVGGAGLATGYLGRAALTAERFVADPTSTGERLYRTGDLARRHPDGRLEILGRVDQQVKIRGHRVEPGEVETALCRHPEVAEAAVVAHDGPIGAELVAHVRPVPGWSPSEPALRDHLARLVPDYMLPSHVLLTDALPTTPNGKLDRNALPPPAAATRPPAGGRPASSGTAHSGTESTITRILATVLELDRVGPHDDFFSLGGDSLRAVHATLALNAELGTSVPVNALFEMRTAYGLARLVDEGEDEPPLCAQPPGQPRRMSASQWRLWLHQHLAPTSLLHSHAVAVRVPESADAGQVQLAVDTVVGRHDTLRTSYPVDEGGGPAPVVHDAGPGPVDERQGCPDAELSRLLAEPFDLAASPPVRFRAVRGEDGDRFLLVAVHEIAADHRSRGLLVRQLRQALAGRHGSARPPAFQHGDYAAWQRRMAGAASTRRHLDHWRAALDGLDPATLETDRPRPTPRQVEAAAVTFDIPGPAVAAIHELTSARDAPLAVGLLTAFVDVLRRHTTGDDLTVGVHVDGAGTPELQQMVGPFEQVVLIRVGCAGAETGTDLLDRVRESAIGALGHAAPTLEDVHAATIDVVEPTAPGRHPLFDVSFALRPPTGLSDLDLPAPTEIEVDLHCEMGELPDGGIRGRLDYLTAVLDHETVVALARELVRAVTEAPVAWAAHRGSVDPGPEG